ncbi:MAG: hypothetical protein PVI91_04455 [Gammaproteobacteria bacterium]|jgi:hypothetical protein
MAEKPFNVLSFCTVFVELPLASLDRLKLQKTLDEIGQPQLGDEAAGTQGLDAPAPTIPT